VEAGARLGAEAREELARAALAEHPDARVAAISDVGVFVEMPASVPLTGQVVWRAESALRLVPTRDRRAIVAAWEEASSSGVGTAQVRFDSDPEHVATIQIVDVRETHGVFLGILVTDGDIDAITATRPPRLARVRKDSRAVFLEADANTTAILGWDAEELVGQQTLDFVHPDDHDAGIEAWMAMLAMPGVAQPTRLRHRRKDGSWLWLEVTNNNRLADPDHQDILSDLVDISDEMAAHEELRARERLLHRIAETLPIGLCQADSERRIVYANERLHEILGAPPAATIDEQLAPVLGDDWSALGAALSSALGDGVDSDVEVQIQRSGRGPVRRCLARIRALTDDDGAPTGAIVCVEDITTSWQMRAELERRASYDMLTRCHNRSSVMAALEAALAPGADTDTAVIFVDIDRFKAVNDRFGHAAGDDLLVVVANRLTAAIRDGDILGRIGGDEFLVVCSKVHSPAEALEVGQRIAETLRGDVALAQVKVSVTASVGVACGERTDLGADELVRHADTAMYESKHEGAGRAVLFDPGAGRSNGTSPPSV
jgi:diguanylate cyclase (GGDEF)-like protein/PAS domain S-box-containing protein